MKGTYLVTVVEEEPEGIDTEGPSLELEEFTGKNAIGFHNINEDPLGKRIREESFGLNLFFLFFSLGWLI